MTTKIHRIGRSPVDLRRRFGEAIRSFRSVWHRPQKARRQAKRIVLMARKHPWLMDQIPWDVFDLAVKAAKG
jgi:hypothetical protein